MAAAQFLKKQPEGVLLVGNKGAEVGTAFSLIESKHRSPVLDGISLKVYGGKRLKTKENTVGLGISKRILKKDRFELGLGVFATKSVKTIFNRNFKDGLNIAVGFSGKLKF